MELSTVAGWRDPVENSSFFVIESALFWRGIPLPARPAERARQGFSDPAKTGQTEFFQVSKNRGRAWSARPSRSLRPFMNREDRKHSQIAVDAGF